MNDNIGREKWHIYVGNRAVSRQSTFNVALNESSLGASAARHQSIAPIVRALRLQACDRESQITTADFVLDPVVELNQLGEDRAQIVG
jgi:hypothetical protein